MLFIITI